MNLHIKELEKQATEFQKIPYGGIDGVFREAFVFNKEKFAELLVLECAKIADTAEPFLASDLIKEYFGVKE